LSAELKFRLDDDRECLLLPVWIITTVLDMNAFDKHSKSVTAWCEDCDCVFDTRWNADHHQEEKSHRVKVMEFWITSRK
jgi:hypothetical protein